MHLGLFLFVIRLRFRFALFLQDCAFPRRGILNGFQMRGHQGPRQRMAQLRLDLLQQVVPVLLNAPLAGYQDMN